MKSKKDIKRFRGIGQFGPAYQMMFENDSHAPGSVDQALLNQMVKLCAETARYICSQYTPLSILYKKGTRPKLERYVQNIRAESPSNLEFIKAISSFTSSLQETAEQDVRKMLIGGLEEEIIERGSDWCTDLARVGCALYQVAGFPSRLTILVDLDRAYSAHVIVEVYQDGVWGAIDTSTNVVYRCPDKKPASVWNLMRNPQLIAEHSRNQSKTYTNAGQFSAAAVINYFVWRWNDYDYSVSKVNSYYVSILEMADKGWPGGIRWLHNEDRRTDKKLTAS